MPLRYLRESGFEKRSCLLSRLVHAITDHLFDGEQGFHDILAREIPIIGHLADHKFGEKRRERQGAIIVAGMIRKNGKGELAWRLAYEAPVKPDVGPLRDIEPLLERFPVARNDDPVDGPIP